MVWLTFQLNKDIRTKGEKMTDDIFGDSEEKLTPLEEYFASKDPPKSIADFMKFRPEICELMNKVAEHSIAITNAPCKSGKKDMVIYSAKLDAGNDTIKHVFVTSLYTVQIKSQWAELREAGIEVLNIRHKLPLAFRTMGKLLESCSKVVVHFDESDYGTAKESCIHPFFEKFFRNEKIDWKFYSASNQEASLSEYLRSHGAREFTYTPPPLYKGAEYFLDNDYAIRSDEFYNIDGLTKHGKGLILDFHAQKERSMAIVRLSEGVYKRDDQNELVRDKEGNPQFENNLKFYNMFKSETSLLNMLERAGISVIFLDASTSKNFDWKRATLRAQRDFEKSEGKLKTLVVLNQLAGRSTDIYCHPCLYFFHDHRPNSNYNTHIQSSGRVFGFVPDEFGYNAKLYTDPDVLKVAAGRMTPSEWEAEKHKKGKRRRISSRTSSTMSPAYGWTFHDKDDPLVSQVRAGGLEGREEDPLFRLSKHTATDLADVILQNKRAQSLAIEVDEASPAFLESYEALIDALGEGIEGKVALYQPKKRTVDIETGKKSIYSQASG
tara:strand:- start:1574 stop:3226 length:1653 start_codon:yes stop_codon:yes gene_type:complete